MPIAFFYGEDPILKLTLDNGKTWQNVYFPTSEDIGRPIIYRVIGFVDENFGYAALGTDWSMGGGEWKQLYVTSDKGKTWNKLPTPFNGTSSKLVDFYMYDQNTGLLMLENRENESFPLAYVTTDGGKNWQEVDYPILEDTQYIVNIESITFDGKSYYIKFGQGNYDILKIIYKTDKLDSRWDFVNVTEENIHTVG